MEKYEVINQIGRGNFGKIYKIKRKSDNKILIWKEIDYNQMTEKEKEQIVNEVNILRELNHPNIVRYYDRIIDKKNSKIYIIMEYCEGGDISQLINNCKKNKEYISEEMIWKIFTQILKAVNEIHTHKQGIILHRDIKPSNIFLDQNNNIKLGDFGLSRLLPPESSFAYSHVGTPYYMSPEQIDETKYNEKSDIWSLGCFLYELAEFRPPFQAKNQIQLGIKIKSGKIERINKRYSNELWKCICYMMNTNYEKRPSACDLMKIPEIKIRIKEEEVNELFKNVIIYKEKLKNKEIELDRREKELDDREKKLDEMEKNNLFKENELNEKEKNLVELEKKLKMSTSTWFSNSRLKSSGNSDSSNNFIVNSGTISPNLNCNNKNYIFRNSINNELENFLYYTNNNREININNANDILAKENLILPEMNKLSKTSNIYLSLENVVNNNSKNNNNRIGFNCINQKDHKAISPQSRSFTDCLFSENNRTNIINFENINQKQTKINKSTTNFENSKKNEHRISLGSPIKTSKNKIIIKINAEKIKSDSNIIKQQKNISQIDNNILINSNKTKNSLSNLINYSSLLSNMNITQTKKYNIKFNTNVNVKRNFEEQKNNKEQNIFYLNKINNNSHKRTNNKISLIKNTKKNLNKLKQIMKRSNTPRIDKFPTKIEYKDNGTFSNYITNSKFYSKNKENNKSEYMNSFGNILINVKGRNRGGKESSSLINCINLKKNARNNNQKNITYRSNSSFNMLKKVS